MQLLLDKHFAQTYSLSLRYNQSLGEEAALSCEKMTGTVQLVFCKAGTSEYPKQHALFRD
jgi:hypothetical protein